MTVAFLEGDTLINAERRELGIPRHLWIVLSAPERNPDRVLIVNITSNPDWDASCEIHPGEHVFIDRVSYVNFPAARITSVSQLRAGLNGGVLHFHEPVSADLLARIRAGAARSPYLSKECYLLLEEQGLIPH